jgi:hypothetical protein
MLLEQIMKAQGDVMLPKEGEYGLAQPARIAEFDGPAIRTRRRVQEAGQAVEVNIPARRQLH